MMKHLSNVSKKGILLFELLLVITLLLASLSIAQECFRFLDQFLVRMEAHKLAIISTALSYKAQIEQREQVLIFDHAHNKYAYGDAHEEKLSHNVIFGVALNAHGPPAYPAKPLATPISFINKRIRFFPDGSIQAGSVYLCNNDKTCLYAFTIPVCEIPVPRTYKYIDTEYRWDKIV